MSTRLDMTRFDAVIGSENPRPEYPRPDFCRDDWMNLNGTWEFEDDPARTGRERGLPDAGHLADRITVPFCRESRLSGLERKDFCDAVWYRRAVRIPAVFRNEGRRVIVHIGASDYQTEVWVNGKSVGTHIGGYNAFSFDITDTLTEAEEQVITVCATDLLRSGRQCGGKQSVRYDSYDCSYTRTTGIWQTVWLESVPAAYIRSMRVFPSVADGKVTLELNTVGGDGQVVRAEAFYEGRAVGAGAAVVAGHHVCIEVKLDEVHLWEIGAGRLYDLSLTLDGEEPDRVSSYFGLREIAVHKGILFLNGKAVFQRLVLDQGFNPWGVLTAPTAEELRADIDRSMACGFNGARLHQKVFEPRFLYECDRAGYIVWGEQGNWGLHLDSPWAYEGFLPDWTEIVERDFNHPAIIGWCPLNETERGQLPTFVTCLVRMTRALDPTRPVIDASGWRHIEGLTDILDTRNYEQDPAVLQKLMDAFARGEAAEIGGVKGIPTFVSEYGGIRWASAEDKGWGYGNAPEDAEAFLTRLAGLTRVIAECPVMGGYCYTQLTDVEQEVNGLYTYDRRAKFDPAKIYPMMTVPAAIENAQNADKS